MTGRPPRCMALHDLSGLGRCSLSVILPVMSAMGIQVCPVPTAVLSAHTGGFDPVTGADLTGYLDAALRCYRELGLGAECVYTGYLSSPEQAEICRGFFRAWPSALKVVDPVMGDNGKLYRGFGAERAAAVVSLALEADVITPNPTEAAFLLDEEPGSVLTADGARSMLIRLSRNGTRSVVVTGAALSGGEQANLCFDRERGGCWKSVIRPLPVHCPGTGDLFTAVLTAGIMRGDRLDAAADRAARYVELTVRTTLDCGTPPREGVLLERTLGRLTENGPTRGCATL